MAYPILGNPKPAFFDSSGSPLASGTITVQNPSDSTAKASYPTADDANANTNSTTSAITLDARGEPTSTQLWGKDGEDYKVIVKDSAGSTVYTIDDIRLPGPSRRAAVTFTSADATPTVAESNVFITAGTTAITDFDNGVVGDTIKILAASTITITHGSPVSLLGAINFNMVAGDTLTLTMFSDQVWEEVGRSTATTTNAPRKVETVTGTNAISAAETGTIYFLNAAGGFTSTLPAPAVGLNYKFVVKAAPSTAYVITTNGGADIMIGGINELEVDTSDDGPYDANADTLNFVASVAVVGDWVECVSDGTSWYYTGQTKADGGVTTSTS